MCGYGRAGLELGLWGVHHGRAWGVRQRPELRIQLTPPLQDSALCRLLAVPAPRPRDYHCCFSGHATVLRVGLYLRAARAYSIRTALVYIK